MFKINVYCPQTEKQVVSITDLAEGTGMEYLEAQGFVKALIRLGVASKCGTRRTSQKGKPTNLYEIPMCIQLTVYQEVVKAA